MKRRLKAILGQQLLFSGESSKLGGGHSSVTRFSRASRRAQLHSGNNIGDTLFVRTPTTKPLSFLSLPSRNEQMACLFSHSCGNIMVEGRRSRVRLRFVIFKVAGGPGRRCCLVTSVGTTAAHNNFLTVALVTKMIHTLGPLARRG